MDDPLAKEVADCLAHLDARRFEAFCDAQCALEFQLLKSPGRAALLALALCACVGSLRGDPREGADLTTLRQAAGGRLRIGAAVDLTALTQEATYRAVLAEQFDSVTTENAMKWGPIQPQPRVWRFEPADAFVSFAQAHGMRVRGHALVWHRQLPAWVSEQMSRDELSAALDAHITTEVTHFRGKVAVWDVVNEALTDSGDGFRPIVFEHTLGSGYIAQAFRVGIHQARS